MDWNSGITGWVKCRLVYLCWMNYLAHFYLADPEEDLMFGNYIGDGVKGSDLKRYPKEVIRGIRLHRFIDSYTDAHELVLEAKKIFYPTQAKFSGVVVDVLFDHMLALHWKAHHPQSLNTFAQRCYGIVGRKQELMPARSQRFFYFMLQHNILEGYAELMTIKHVFKGMDSRTKYTSNMLDAVNIDDQKRAALKHYFDGFFPELINATHQWKKTH
ncbi:MAG: ACP phosphodiesterase [Salibacteraceae bacterium]